MNYSPRLAFCMLTGDYNLGELQENRRLLIDFYSWGILCHRLNDLVHSANNNPVGDSTSAPAHRRLGLLSHKLIDPQTTEFKPPFSPISSTISSKEEEELNSRSLINMCVGEEVPTVTHEISYSAKVLQGTVDTCGVDYFRSESEWIEKQQQTICTPSIDVYAWLMDKVNCFGEGYPLWTAYGELIHLLRDKTLINPDGTYLDDDFDTWVTESVGDLENFTGNK